MAEIPFPTTVWMYNALNIRGKNDRIPSTGDRQIFEASTNPEKWLNWNLHGEAIRKMEG